MNITKSELESIKNVLDYFEYHNKNLTKKQFEELDIIRYILLWTKKEEV